MIISENILLEYADKYAVELDSAAIERFDRYAELLIQRNKEFNLTAISDPLGITVKHFADSLSLFGSVKLRQGMSVMDVGSGAGFPGIALLIARPDLKLTLLDSTNKKVLFLNEVLSQLSLSGKAIHSRAEEAGQNPLYREKYDLVTARAVSALKNLAEYCLPFAKKGGIFAAMKGSRAAEEIDEANKAIRILGGEIKSVQRFDLGGEGERNIVVIKKVSQSSPKYPRPSAKIAKYPLE